MMGSIVSKKPFARPEEVSMAPLSGIQNSNDTDVLKFSFPWHTHEGIKRTLVLRLDSCRSLKMKCSAFSHVLQLQTTHTETTMPNNGGGDEGDSVSTCASTPTTTRILAVCRRKRNLLLLGGPFEIFCLAPVYPNQKPASVWKRYKGQRLYLYATISTDQKISFVHHDDNNHKPTLEVQRGPKGSREKSLVPILQPSNTSSLHDRRNTTTIHNNTVATWKRQNYPCENDVSILPPPPMSCYSSTQTRKTETNNNHKAYRDMALILCIIYSTDLLDVDDQSYKEAKENYWSGKYSSNQLNLAGCI
mgnify:CR=1 FL=1